MTIIHGFELVRDEQIEEYQTRARLYRHVRTGAELLSLENDDENKCFGVALRTPPHDSTGIAHILEHCVLAGSRKYPVKDPFFELVKSSVKTFLNAMTYPDRTVYPVASTNLADFYNLVDVYLDAVFFPLIKPETLRQEGWRYELKAKGEPVVFQGVVFNEMKGAYSSPDGVLYRYAQQALFPDTTYGHSSGGDPKAIPDLTYEQFQQFHATLYHPSNARLYFYGDDPPERRLEILDAVLRQFEARRPESDVALQPPFEAPRVAERTYAAPAEESGKKGMVTVQWMIGEVPSVERSLALSILSYMLVGTAAAPLRKALIDSRLGDDLTGSGYNDSIRQHTFAVGMKGIDPADGERVEQLVLETLQRLVREGIDDEQIAAALNSFEFSLRENNTGSFPRGLSLFFRSLESWLYGGDPLEPLRFEGPLAAISGRVRIGERLFEQLIQETLLDNPHRVRLLLRPDPTQAERDAAEERARLDAYQATLSDADLDRLVAETEALRRMQEEPDDPVEIAKVPTLTLKDLERQGKRIPSEEREAGGAPLLFHDLFTNGIVYLELAFDLRSLPPELLPYAPLFARALTEMGTEREDYVRLVQRIGRETGGISAFVTTNTHVLTGEPLGRFVVRGKATLGQAQAMLAIMSDLLHSVRLDDQERFRQIVTRIKAGRESSLVPSGNSYARKRIAARLDPAEWADEQMGGIAGIFFVRELERRVSADWPGVLADLEAVRRHLVNRGGVISNVTLDEASFGEFAPALDAFVASLPAAPYTPAVWRRAEAGPNEGLIIPAKVNYVAKGANVRALGLEVSGASSAVTRFLYNAYLLEKIRVQGGAYGAGSSYDRVTGIFVWSSYRDPNLLRTLDVYDGTGAFLRSVELDRLTVERSIVGTIGDIDGYQLPDAKGYTALVRHLTGVTDAWRQQIREQLLDATDAEFRAFAEVADAARDHGVVAVVGSAEAIEAANRERSGLLTPVKVL